MTKKKKKLVFQKRYLAIIAVFAIALVFFSQGLVTQSFLPGSEMPLVGEITLGIQGKTLTENEKVKIKNGETLTAQWDAEWWNRSYSSQGNALLGTAWYLDGQFVGLMSGSTQSVNKEYIGARNSDNEPIYKEQWSWQTLPFVAQMKAINTTQNISKTGTIPIQGLASGTHQVTVKASLISDASGNASVFESSGACYPLLSPSQGFPCPGVFGETTITRRNSTPACTPTGGFYNNRAVYSCPTQEDVACRNACCYSTGLSAPEGDTFWQGGQLYVTCYTSVKDVWGPWVSGGTESQSYETAVSSIKAGEIVAVAEFEVVGACPFACCVDEPGYQDKFCSQSQVCSSNVCVVPVQPCPFACCENESGYVNKTCGSGEYCVQNDCIAEPPVPAPPFWQGVIDLIISWLKAIFPMFFSIVGETTVTPGLSYSYDIALVAPSLPDSDYSDGFAEYQYANWALVDSSGNIVQEGVWEQVDGVYEKTVGVVMPANVSNHALIGVIYQYDLSYDFASGSWKTVSEAVVVKEGIDLQTSLPVPEPPKPPLDFFYDLLAGFWNWLIGLFG